MPPQLVAVLVSPFTYAFIAVAVWVGRIAIKRFVEGQVDHQFALQLENHRASLQLVTDEAKYEYQRQLVGVNLYLRKQHAAAAEVYTAVRVAHGAVSKLFGAQPSLAFEDCNEADLARFMDDWEFLGGTKEQVLALWRADKAKGIAMLRAEIAALRVPTAENKMQAARNAMYLSEIYFSDATIQAFDAFVEVANEWLARAYFPSTRREPDEPLSRKQLHSALDAIQVALRSELGEGRLRRPPTPAPNALPS